MLYWMSTWDNGGYVRVRRSQREGGNGGVLRSPAPIDRYTDKQTPVLFSTSVTLYAVPACTAVRWGFSRQGLSLPEPSD